MKHLYRFFLGFLLLVGCGKDEYAPKDTGTDYYPLAVGLSWTYKVTETIYSEVSAPEDRSYRLRVTVADSVLNAEGSYSYILYRSTQSLPNEPWLSLDTWSVRKTDKDVIIAEGNVPYRKLIFPVRPGLKWDGNLYNAIGQDMYEMTETEPLQLAGTTFEEVIRVEQEMNEDFIVSLDEREEFYAKNVGLVKQSITQYNYCTAENCIGQQKIKNGRQYVLELESYERN